METGETFPEFALRCAHAFGALATLRDEPSDAPIPIFLEFKPSPYYTESLKKHKAELARLQSMKIDERTLFGVEAKQKQIEQHRAWLAKNKTENQRLDEMAEKVAAWMPPSSDHQGLKKFMLQQIDVSRNGTEYIEWEIVKATAKAPSSYYVAAVIAEEHGVAYCEEELAKEIERTDGRNLWVKQLRESLTGI
jgi:hypothetical protein